MGRVLGLDLGPNSIGWALVDEPPSGGGSGLVDMGVRVFPEGVDAFDTAKEVSKSEDRRVKRGMRRQTKRRARRERLLASALVHVGMWPSDKTVRAEELAKDPYQLRVRAVSGALTPFELGRVMLHLCRRRGFLSNRKTDSLDSEAKGLLAEINANEAERVAGGFPTIGAMLAQKASELIHSDRRENDHVRRRHLSRQQMVDEFLAIWKFQLQFHPTLLTDQLKFGSFGPPTVLNPSTGKEELSHKPRAPISRRHQERKGQTDLESFGLFGILFFQRPLYWPKSVIGLCELEPNQKRCPKADRVVERFRILQEVNNLRYIDSGDEIPLNEAQRKKLLDLLAVDENVSFDKLRKKLGFIESVQFNLERGSRVGLKGMTVDVKLAHAKVFGKKWHDRDELEKTAIVRLLLNDDVDEYRKIERLRDQHGFSVEQAERALGVDFGTGYSGLSRKAIERLLPHMERGLVYQSQSDPKLSALHAAGYLRRDELKRRLFDNLPDFTRLKPADCRIGDIPNPVVKRALVELRKVVNAVIREYGKPDAVHVELARTVQVGAERRKEMSKRMRERQAIREDAQTEIRNAGHAARRDGVIRFLLWKEQGSECVYCGRPISMAQLFGGEIDVDHILPRSRCLDDSQMNKVVAHRSCNHDKGQRTPHEWLAGSRPGDYDRMVQHALSLMKRGMMPYAKYRRFVQKELELDKFVARQLTDTGYITRATVEFLELLFDDSSCVLGLKGQLTAELRWQWGLDTILAELPGSPAWQDEKAGRLSVGEKNRADHRHHAIDALVIALTNRSRLHKLSELYRKGGARQHGEILLDPWDFFRQDVAAKVATINVSHRVQRKVAGGLHEETNYGPTENKTEWAIRKPVETLSANEVERIRDGAIRRLVIKKLLDAGMEVGRGKKLDANRVKTALAGLSLPSGVPIKKVRITKPELTIRALRDGQPDSTFVKPGSTHHLCIFEVEEGGKPKRIALFVTMLEAMQRLKRHEPVVQRTHPEYPGARFVMSLSSRELVLGTVDGVERLLAFKTAASTQGQLYFSDQYDGRRSGDQSKHVFTANSLKARKVTVDPLGRVRWAND